MRVRVGGELDVVGGRLDTAASAGVLYCTPTGFWPHCIPHACFDVRVPRNGTAGVLLPVPYLFLFIKRCAMTAHTLSFHWSCL